MSIGSVPMGVPGEEISGIVASIAGLLGAYVIGQGYADGQAVKKDDKTHDSYDAQQFHLRNGIIGAHR